MAGPTLSAYLGLNRLLAVVSTAARQDIGNTALGAVTETAPASDTASSGLNGRLQRIAQRLTSLIALLPASLGVKLTATSLSTTIATDDAVIGATNETAPASDTAASGLNGRLQRIAQRLTALLPAALGAGGGLKVDQASSPWIVKQSDVRSVDQALNSATLNAAHTVLLDGGEGEVGFTFSGLTASGATITFEGSNNVDAAVPVWSAINAVQGATLATTATADGGFRVETGGRTAVRARVSVIGSGNITVSSSASSASSLVTLAQLLPQLPAALGAGGGLRTESAGYRSAATITRPATTPTYDVGDVVGATVAAFEFQNIGPVTGGFVYIDTSRLTVNVASLPSGMGNFRLRFYSATPPSAYADTVTWDLPSGDRSVNRGYLDLGTPVDVGSTLEVEALGHNKLIYVPPGGSLFAYLVTSGSYVATSGAVYEIEINSVGV